MILLLLLLPLLPLSAETFWAILLGDGEDLFLSEVVEKDLRMIQQYTRDVAKTAGFQMAEIVFTGDAVTLESFNALSSLPIRKDDVVFFYWTGHGILEKDKLLPSLQLAKERVPLEEVIALLKNHQPRLIVAMADCCNRLISDQILYKSWALQPYKERLYQELYLGTSGVVVLLAASPGERSLSSSEKGSHFTRQFLATCSDLMAEDTLPSWGVLFERLEEKFQGERQHPYFLHWE